MSIGRNWRGGVLWLVAAAGVGPAWGGDVLFVNNRAGYDGYDGRSAYMLGHGLGPVRSVQTALRRARPGDTIVLLPTGYPYTEPIAVPARSSLGQAKYPITIEGNGVELVGYRAIPTDHWQHVSGGVYRLRRPFAPTGVITSLAGTITREPCELWGPPPTLERGKYAFWQGHFYVKPARPLDLESHALAESAQNAGIIVDRTSHVIIRNFRIRGFRHDAIQVIGPASGVRIENCLLAESGRAGLSVRTNASVELIGSFVTDNAKAGVLVDNVANLRLDRVSIDGNAERARVEATARLEDLGGTPEPLADGPFLLPPDWPTGRPAEPELPEAFEPKER